VTNTRTSNAANLHPDDLLFFNEVVQAMRHVARAYELPLRSVTPFPMPEQGLADRLGDCNGSGDIRLVMRATVNGEWCEEPRTPEKVWRTAAHELAHLRHMNHGAAFQEFWQELELAMQNRQADHREKVLARLVKMQASREGEAAIGNLEAAEAFASAINRMLLEYELNPSDIDYARATDRDPVIELPIDLAKYAIKKKRTRIAWQESLARIVAKSHLCTFLVASGTNKIWFVGTKSHATVAEYAYGIMVPAVEKMACYDYHKAQAAYAKRGENHLIAGFSASWYDAFLKRVEERFEAARKQVVTQAGVDVPGGSSQALIRLDGALVKVRQYMDDKFKARRRAAHSLERPRGSHAAGVAAGKAAADRMVIGRRGVAGGPQKALKG
jgi:hypothetical protein